MDQMNGMSMTMIMMMVKTKLITVMIVIMNLIRLMMMLKETGGDSGSESEFATHDSSSHLPNDFRRQFKIRGNGYYCH